MTTATMLVMITYDPNLGSQRYEFDGEGDGGSNNNNSSMHSAETYGYSPSPFEWSAVSESNGNAA